ncbi:MAG: Anaerobic glycerol-3-phosphate dehydrogenase subunit B [Candidatus Magnetoglobus multicellularis str. Araruama]|uniref:Anaerobic glycerol-3-phosphate dehydrogenase subunit B n=1 Tax=Candidatus Magnetoglobus multicellularis str. Araruama TaxID=890399 RepID=A0A1V1PF35_9BACT|nr:MAG: Anaerobic glycerol-3-phosphate dehydrogenase subunit B [Candidatus Magnetoglobus multicellularis str. Araruama]
MAQLCQDIPNHPYAFLSKDQILKAAKLWLNFLETMTISYDYIPNKNINAITPIGSQKLTHAAPKHIWTGISCFMQRQSALLIDIDGLKGFSARQIKEALQNDWPELETARISFPNTSGEVFTGHMASALESSSVQKQLSDLLLPRVQRVQCIGFPAILGSHYHQKVCENLEQMLGKPIFEIPTLPPSMPGIRLRNAITQGLTKKGGQLFQNSVTHVEPDGKYGFIATSDHKKIFAKNIILATGRFMGKGLIANRKTIQEPLLQLPVYQPESRKNWHDKQFFNPKGHDIHQAGIEVDNTFRPIDQDKKVLYEHLFAIGSILAHNDWMRHKCGSGLAVATAFGAVQQIRHSK